jgi:hypothetical protein
MILSLIAALLTQSAALNLDAPPAQSPGVSAPSSAAPSRSVIHPMVVTGVVLAPDGKPVPAARIDVVSYDSTHRWHAIRMDGEPTEYEQLSTTADAHGVFRFTVHRNVSLPVPAMVLMASADRYAPAIGERFRRGSLDLKLRLDEPKVVRVRFVDSSGKPVRGVEGDFANVFLKTGRRFFAPASLRKSPFWPHLSRSDSDGYSSVTIPASAETIVLSIHDDRFRKAFVSLPLAGKSLQIVLQKPRFVIGKVVAADTGKPVAGAEAREELFGRQAWSRADAQGVFRIPFETPPRRRVPRNENNLILVKPPSDSDFLPSMARFTWPEDESTNAEVAVPLIRGLMVEGRVVERSTGKGVKDAGVFFVPRKNNPFVDDFEGSQRTSRAIRYATDSEGLFRVLVLPGPGHLVVVGPTLDYIHTLFSRGERLYGQRGLDREYYDAVAKINFNPGEQPRPLTIPLTRGVTLRRKVVRPDGSPATGIAMARSYLEFSDNINTASAGMPIDDGLLELPGFEPEQTNPIFILDAEHHCAALASPKASETDVASPPIRLQPCGTAKVRFVDANRKPTVGYLPWLQMTVTPGPPWAGVVEPNQPLQGERIFSSNLAWRGGGRTDSEGRITFPDLIPGAVYEFEDRSLAPSVLGREFTVRPGETLEVGDMTVGQP